MLDNAFGLTDMIAFELKDNRTGKNTQHSPIENPGKNRNKCGVPRLPTINFAPNAYDNYDTVLVDHLPRAVDYVAGSADPDYGVYNLLTHTVTWDIGDLPAYNPEDPDPNVYFHVTVRINSLAEPLSAIVNPVEIESYASYSVDIGTSPVCFWNEKNTIIYS